MVFLLIFAIYYNLDIKFSPNVENQVAYPLFKFWEPVWNIFLEDPESVFHFPEYPFTMLPNYIYLL